MVASTRCSAASRRPIGVSGAKLGHVLLTALSEGQNATVLQLPTAPKTEKEIEEQKRAEYVG
jgi:hypothetical protein